MAERAPTVTLLTDFGPKDSFIGVMKGVITSIAPGTVIIDLCHAVEPQNVTEAGFLLAASYSYFPEGTVHVAVVDPGVGTDRAVLGIKAHGYYFVVPDNGLIVPTVRDPEEAEAVVRIENENYFLQPVSSTFHGRDIFAPVAGHLAKGVPLDSFGLRVSTFRKGAFPEVFRRRLPEGVTILEGEVIHVDNFGNLVTNIRLSPAARVREVTVGRRRIPAFGRTFADTAPGTLLAYVGSSGFLEVAVNRGRASDLFSPSEGQEPKGEKVHVEVEGEPK